MRRLLRNTLTLSCLLGLVQASPAQYTINVDNPATWGTFVAPVGATVTWSQNTSYSMTSHHVLVYNDLGEQVWECDLWCYYVEEIGFWGNLSEGTVFTVQSGYYWLVETNPAVHGDFYVWNSGPLFIQNIADSIAIVNNPYRMQLQFLHNWPAYPVLLQNPPGMQIQQPGNWLVWNPTPQNIGIHTVSIRAYDLQNQSDTLTYQLFTGYNAPPQILSYSPESNASFPFGTQVTYQFAYADTQGLPVTYQWYEDGDSLSITGTSYQAVLDEYGLNPEVKVVLSNGIARDSIVWDLTATATLITAAGGVFTAADNPLLAWQHVDIGPNDSLVLLDGACMYTTRDGWNGANVGVYGKLRLSGTPGNPVRIMSLDTSYHHNWESPFCIGMSSASHILEHVIFQDLYYVLGGENGYLGGSNAQIVVRNCTFNRCTYAFQFENMRNAAIYGNNFEDVSHGLTVDGDFTKMIYLFNNFAVNNDTTGQFFTGNGDSLYAFNNVIVGGGEAFQAYSDIHILNNTVVNSTEGIAVPMMNPTSGIYLLNNIIQTTGYAVLAFSYQTFMNVVIDYNVIPGTLLYSNVNPGWHEIYADPQFVDPANLNFNLQPTSPAINSAAPGSFPDPDCTPADRGALYYDQGDTSVIIQVINFDSPFFIPATGGTVALNATLRNTTAQPETTFAWLSCYQPDSSLLTPLGNPQQVVIPAAQTLDLSFTDTQAPNSPAGLYAYQVNLGTYDPPSLIPIRLARVFFAKLTEGPVGVQEPPKSAAEISQFSLSCNPNPFNSQIRITLRLPSLTNVHLELFDLLGRQVADLQDGALPAGLHTFNWNADAHASGIYLLQAHVGDQTLTNKLLLVK